MIGQQILEIIAMTPGCREEDIYRQMYSDEHETRALIAALVAVGDIIAVGADGQTKYEFTSKFKATDVYKRLMWQRDIENAITPGLPPVERAIAYVRTVEVATSSQLHIVMELDIGQQPSHHLAEALRDGRLVKDGKAWRLGPAALEEGGLIDVLEVEAA